MTDYQLLPALPSEDYARLRADIAQRGVLVPIERDEHGAILDGHHRWQIAQELGIDCPEVRRIGLAEHEKRLHAVSLNLARRHLTDAQKVLLGRQIEPDVAEAARRRQGERNDLATSGTVGPEVAHDTRRTRDEVADKIGLESGRTYDRAKKVIERAEEVAPDLVERMSSGEITIRDAARELRQHAKHERVTEIASADVPEMTGTFTVLYADPPWRYEHAPDDTRKIENHYPTMSLDEIKAMDVPASDDAVLFLWATSPKLEEALQVVRAWGFEYRTCAVWVKDKIGMGYYLRQQHELLLVCRRGGLPVPDPANRPSSVIQATRGVHSSKPVEVYDLIERMYPEFSKLEIFQRTPRPGWSGWGNQAA